MILITNYLYSLFRKKTSPYSILERFNLIKNECSADKQVNSFFSNRASLIIQILKENDVEYIIDTFTPKNSKMKLCNIIVEFNNAELNETTIHDVHHDVRNVNSLNILDNTASVANLLSLAISLNGKKLKRKTVIAFVDGEEVGCYGAKRMVEQIEKGVYGEIIDVVTHELTASGKVLTNKFLDRGFITRKLYEIDSEMVESPTPYCDVNIYLEAGINVVCLCTLPVNQMKQLVETGFCDDWGKCHKMNDDMSSANEKDMKNYVKTLKQFSL